MEGEQKSVKSAELKAANRVDSAEARSVAALVLSETGLGSLLHAFSIPLAGHFLSLNQALFLCRSLADEDTRSSGFARVLRISMAAALMKSFSPAGKVLTPMLAIAMQGWLFAAGVFFAGAGILGQVLGSALLSFWGFLQPAILGYLIYGKTFFDSIVWTWEKLAASLSLPNESGIYLLLLLPVLKLILAALVALLAKRRSFEFWTHLLQQRSQTLLSKSKKLRKPRKSAWAGALSDLLSPLFLSSFVITSSFIVFSSAELQTEWTWILLRPLAIAFAVFYATRSVSPQRLRSLFLKLSPASEALLEESQDLLGSKKS